MRANSRGQPAKRQRRRIHRREHISRRDAYRQMTTDIGRDALVALGVPSDIAADVSRKVAMKMVH